MRITFDDRKFKLIYRSKHKHIIQQREQGREKMVSETDTHTHTHGPHDYIKTRGFSGRKHGNNSFAAYIQK